MVEEMGRQNPKHLLKLFTYEAFTKVKVEFVTSKSQIIHYKK